MPKGPKEERFGRRIFAGLVEAARRRGHAHLFLYVDPENEGAKKFYKEFGFEVFDQILEDGRNWVIMQLSLKEALRPA